MSKTPRPGDTVRVHYRNEHYFPARLAGELVSADENEVVVRHHVSNHHGGPFNTATPTERVMSVEVVA